MRRNIRNIFLAGGIPIVVISWLAISWRRWPDCLIDFGQQLYVPWQISQGKVLYRDIYYSYGPLAAYVNGLFFKCFGTNLHVLFIASFICLMVIGYLLYAIFKSAYGVVSGIISLYIFFGIFAFGHYLLGLSSYNFISPYSYELVYGFALSLAGIFFIDYWLKRPKAIYLVIIGVLLGLVFLTKFEVFLAFLGAVTAAVILNILCRGITLFGAVKNFCMLLGFALIPPVIFFVYLCQYMPWGMAIRALGTALFSFQDPGNPLENIFDFILGFNTPLNSLWFVLFVAVGYVFAFASLGALAKVISFFKKKGTRFIFIFVSCVLAILTYVFINYRWVFSVLRAVPLVLIVFILIRLIQLFKRHVDPQRAAKRAFHIVLLLYALILSFKIFLSFTPFQYGFVLGLPGTICMACILTNDVACWGRVASFYSPKVYRILVLVVLSGALVLYFRWSKDLYDHMNYAISKGKDAFWADDSNVSPRAFLTDTMVQWLGKNTNPTDTLVVMPTGAMINYLSRRINPIPMILFDRRSLEGNKESEIINLLSHANPGYIIFTGYGSLGAQYGQSIVRWVLENYNIIGKYIMQGSQGNGSVPAISAFLMKKI